MECRNNSSFPLSEHFIDSSFRFVCCEEIGGRRWKYLADENAGSGKFRKGSIRAVSLQTPLAPIEELMAFIRSYVVPEGFPGSVTPSYVPYMSWRALKDGAGRVGKMLFARQGKKFDYDLKQLRFAGDLLMELGAGVELATAAVPHLFLPFACAANVAKNVAAVTSTSTRTPFYKAFAKGVNIGDVTAKGECVGDIADLLGTGLKYHGFTRKSIIAEYICLPVLWICPQLLSRGQVPSLEEGNMEEKIFSFPWLKDRPVIIGPRFKDAFQDPAQYFALEPLFV
ncbi:Protein root UVB sensitive 6 [Ancistrocladus abbreviatus]